MPPVNPRDSAPDDKLRGAANDRSKDSQSPQVQSQTNETHSLDVPLVIPPSSNQHESRVSLLDEIRRSVPLGVELYRAYRYQVPLRKNAFELAVLKLHAPDHLESTLQEWRRSLEERFPKASILVRRVQVYENVRNHLRNRFAGRAELTQSDIPEIERMVEVLCGAPPVVGLAPRSLLPQRVDLRNDHFLAIDPPGAAPEDLLRGERLSDGKLRHLVAFVDITDHISIGSDADRYALRVGSTYYGRNRIISTLGPVLSHGLAAFRVHQSRPAWVVETIIDPNQDSPIVSASIKRALVANHANLDPRMPVSCSARSNLGRNLSALVEITRILERRHRSVSPLIRIDGDGSLSRIVAASMIHAKSVLGGFFDREAKVPAIYRVHQAPSEDVLQGLTESLGACGIAADLTDLRSGVRSARIWQQLQESSNPQARDLLNNLLDTFLLRSQYSSRNVGHFSLRVDAYAEPKPRDAAGVTDQLQLDAFLRGGPLLSEEEISRRANHLNQQRWRSDERQYKLRFYEMLMCRLLQCGDVFLGEVATVDAKGLYVSVEGFSRVGVVRSKVRDHLQKGDVLALKLESFSLEDNRFNFSVVTP